MTIRSMLYGRVSTDMQAETGLSIPAQLNEMREFAERRGWTIVGEFVDPGFSGSSLNRPGLQTLLQLVEQKACEVVLVHETSRLSRSIFDTFHIFELLGQHEVGFASVREPQFDFTTPQGRFFLTMLAAFNQYYLDILRQHTAKGKRERARQGLYNASITPYGYQHTGDSRTPPDVVEQEAEGVRLAFETYAAGNASFQDVADRLNDAGFQTRTGGRFGKDVIDDMLRNRFYAGDIVYGAKRKGGPREVFQGQHEAVISLKLFETCERMRRRRWGAARSYQPEFRVYLLNTISICSICGRTLRAQGTPRHRYYREMSRSRGYVDCPSAQRGVMADVVERQVEAIFRELRLPPDWQAEVEDLLDREAEKTALHNERARLEAEGRRLKDLYVKGYFEDDLGAFEQAFARIQRELDALPVGDLEAIEDAAETLEMLGEVWDEADLATKRDLLRLVLQQVEIDVQQGRVAGLRPYAPFLPLFRQAEHLLEVEPGLFIPLWPPPLAEERSPDQVLPSLSMKIRPGRAILWPQVISLPAPPAGQRITPVLSSFLKEYRRQGKAIRKIVELPRPNYPALLLDERKWPDRTIERLSRSPEVPPHIALPDGSVSFLYTPSVLYGSRCISEWLAEGVRLLEPGGWWVLLELMPASMPGHWVYRYFPEVRGCENHQNLAPSPLFLNLQEQGLEVKMVQRTYYQAVSCEVALDMARQRAASHVLSALAEEAYQAGLERLAEACHTQGANNLLASHFCLAEIVAVRPDQQQKPSAGRRLKRP
jgi:site-specific DNA recombinase